MLRKGTIEGYFGAYEIIKTYKRAGTIMYVTLPPLNVILHILVMNHDVWNSLPAEIQQVFDEASGEYVEIMGQAWERGEIEGWEYAEPLGVQRVYWSDEDLAKLKATLEPMRENWVKTKEAAPEGSWARQALNDVRDIVDKYIK